MAYSDDAKYVSAYNKAVAAGNKARLLLADLNKAKPGTARHTDLKIKYDLAKADATKYEQERLTRKREIDTAKSKEKETKTADKDKASATADIPVLEYEVQAAKNAGDKAAQVKAEAALKAAKDKAAGIKPILDEDGNVKDGPEEVVNNKFKDFTVNSSGAVTNSKGNVTYFLSIKNADGSSTMQEYESIAKARDAFLKAYSSPGA